MLRLLPFLTLLLLAQSPTPPTAAEKFTPRQAAQIVHQYELERGICIDRDADIIRDEIEELEDQRKQVRADKSLTTKVRNKRTAKLARQIADKRTQLRNTLRGNPEPLPKDLLNAKSWEARNADGRVIDGEPPPTFRVADFGIINPNVHRGFQLTIGHLPEDLPITLAPGEEDAVFVHTHTIHTIRLKHKQINDPFAPNTPAHRKEREYKQISDKETQTIKFHIILRDINEHRGTWTTKPKYKGQGLHQHHFIITEFYDTDPPTLILEPFDLEAFRTRAKQ